MAEERQSSESLPAVLLLRPFPITPSYKESFNNKFRSLSPPEDDSMPLKDFLTTHAQSVRALFCSAHNPINKRLLECLPSLQLVVTGSGGVEHIDKDECRRRNIMVANAGTVHAEDGADYIIGLLINVLRSISAADRFVRTRSWRVDRMPSHVDFPLGSKLSRKRIGIVGLGAIGMETAKRLEGLGCVVSYNSVKKKTVVSYTFYPTVLDLATHSDVLIVCCVLNDETYHMINKDVLKALGKDGVVINVARGAIIDEQALVQCLVDGEIGGAGLDVFENEPNIPPQLLELDNVVLSPHRAVQTVEAFLDLQDLVIANLEAFFANKPLLSAISF